MKNHTSTPARFSGILLLLLLSFSCEKEIPLSSFDFDYGSGYKIEADLYPSNPDKSVLRIDRTFTIDDTMSIERAHVNGASAVLLSQSGVVLSRFTWKDTAAAYPYLTIDEFDPTIGMDSLAAALDTQYYGAYKLENTGIDLSPEKEYTVRVQIGPETFDATFSPYPAVEFSPFQIDSVVTCRCPFSDGTYRVIYARMRADTARLRWPEDKNAYLYTVYIHKTDEPDDAGPQLFSFPGPVLNLNLIPGEYDIIIGTMNEEFYRHYYLNDFPQNHPARNTFSGDALGYAGTLNERYLHLTIKL